MARDHFKLQAIILLWGFTAILGAKIGLPSTEIVVLRTAIAAIVLAVWLGGRLRVSRKHALQFFLTGLVIGVHWVAFFGAVKVANVSICMIGIATMSLWTALLEPLMIPSRKLRPIDLIFGAIIVVGVTLIFWAEFQYGGGFLIAILSALMGAIFSILNSFHVKKAHHQVITFYEMLGAGLIALICLPLLTKMENISLPTMMDWVYLTILAVLCTVVAFSEYIELLKRMSVFTINFANNLEPLYGIALAALILGDYQHLGPGFYGGAALIIITIAAYPAVRMKIKSAEKSG